MAITLAPYIFDSFSLGGRSLHFIWGGCQFPNFWHSRGLRWVKGFLINDSHSKTRQNADDVKDWAISSNRVSSIDTIGEIAQTPILSLYCVDALRGNGLRAVVASFAESIYTVFGYCVDLALETFAPSGLSDEAPTDWVKSD